jgi:PII-like signaling protein
MDGSLLRFYIHENDRVHGQLAWEWLLRQANELGVRGGSAFRAMAGFGRDRVLHEERFFELAGTVTVEVEFIVSEDEARQLLELVERAGLRAFFARTPAHFGVIGEKGREKEKGRL